MCYNYSWGILLLWWVRILNFVWARRDGWLFPSSDCRMLVLHLAFQSIRQSEHSLFTTKESASFPVRKIVFFLSFDRFFIGLIEAINNGRLSPWWKLSILLNFLELHCVTINIVKMEAKMLVASIVFNPKSKYLSPKHILYWSVLALKLSGNQN